MGKKKENYKIRMRKMKLKQKKVSKSKGLITTDQPISANGNVGETIEHAATQILPENYPLNIIRTTSEDKDYLMIIEKQKETLRFWEQVNQIIQQENLMRRTGVYPKWYSSVQVSQTMIVWWYNLIEGELADVLKKEDDSYKGEPIMLQVLEYLYDVKLYRNLGVEVKCKVDKAYIENKMGLRFISDHINNLCTFNVGLNGAGGTVSELNKAIYGLYHLLEYMLKKSNTNYQKNFYIDDLIELLCPISDEDLHIYDDGTLKGWFHTFKEVLQFDRNNLEPFHKISVTTFPKLIKTAMNVVMKSTLKDIEKVLKSPKFSRNVNYINVVLTSGELISYAVEKRKFKDKFTKNDCDKIIPIEAFEFECSDTKDYVFVIKNIKKIMKVVSEDNKYNAFIDDEKQLVLMRNILL